MYKLEFAVRRSDRDASRTSWVLNGIIDVVLNLNVVSTELSVANLIGRGPKNGKGSPYPICVAVTW